MSAPVPVVFIPALLCDERLYGDVIAALGDQVEAHVMVSPLPTLAASVADILARAPAKFVLVGTSYGGSLALELALAAPERVMALWLMGCDPGLPRPGGAELAAGLEATPDAVFDMLGGLVVHSQATGAAATFKAMAHTVGGAAGAAQVHALNGRAEARPRLRELNMPALVLWGTEDALVPVAEGRQLAADLPQAQFHQFEGCGHLPTLEKAEGAAALFARFLGEKLPSTH